MPATFESFRRLRTQLADHGHYPGLAWWDDTFGRFYASGANRLVARVGRGGAKSTSMVDAGINEVVCGDWHVPDGETHYFAYVSQNKNEAQQRLGQIAARLRALGFPFEKRDDEIVLKDERLGFRVFACQVGAVSGFRCIGFCADELAKWSNADHSANPAPEVVASIRAMCITHKNTREFFVSSPLGKSDLHYKMVEAGSGPGQLVVIAPTWIANNTITEQETRDKEPDDRIWRREYLAIPQDSASAAFSSEHIARAMRPLPRGGLFARPIMGIDPSSGLGDSFASIAAGWWVPNNGEPIDHVPDAIDTEGNDITGLYLRDERGKYLRDANAQPILAPGQQHRLSPAIVFSGLKVIEGKFFGKILLDDIVDDICVRGKRWGARHIVGDAHEQLSIDGRVRTVHNLEFVRTPWTPELKSAAVMRLRRLMAEGTIVLPQDYDLRREMLEFTEKILPTGAVTYGARASGKDDRVAAILSCLMGEAQGLLWHPTRGNGRRGPGWDLDRPSHE